MVASSAPVDQFVVRHPSYFFDASPEHALINPDNLNILVNHVKCAAFELPFTAGEQYGRVDVQEVLGVLQEAGSRASLGRRPGRRQHGPVALDQRVVSGRRGEPAIGVLRQLRRRRSDGRAEGDRRDRLHERALDAASRRPSTSSKAGCSRWRSSTSTDARRYVAIGGLRLLHRRDRPTPKVTILDSLRQRRRRDRAPRRGPRRLARRRVQEDPVPHQRERRFGRARSARAADAHDRLLAGGARAHPGDAAVCGRRSPRRRSSGWRSR